MKDNQTLTRGEAIHQVATQLEGPISMDEFLDRVLEIKPSTAKNPKSALKQLIQYEHLGIDLLLIDQETLVPMHQAMNGVRFRIPLTRQEIERGWLFIDPAFEFMKPRDLAIEDWYFEEINGQSIPVNLEKFKTKVKTLLGSVEAEKIVIDLGWWYKKHGLRRGDNLLITIIDWSQGNYCLQPESSRIRQQHQGEIQKGNHYLADYLFQELESSRDEFVWGYIAIPTAYYHLKDEVGYPPDHWIDILEKDPRMRWMDAEICYADFISPLEQIFGGGMASAWQPTSPTKRLSKEQKTQVYRFKAALWYRKSLWRRIEIQGGQNLADFDRILRDAFDHDVFDHLSGFWKLLPRGKSRRYREIDLGRINPFEGGEAADILVGSLKLETGQALKYVYDFGDWIEHRIELEAITAPESEAQYPRIVGQNKPRYHYCLECKEAGKKEIATLICLTCSNRRQENVFLCETCADRGHEDCYIEEILY
jgi:hypothetical protein